MWVPAVGPLAKEWDLGHESPFFCFLTSHTFTIFSQSSVPSVYIRRFYTIEKLFNKICIKIMHFQVQVKVRLGKLVFICFTLYYPQAATEAQDHDKERRFGSKRPQDQATYVFH